MSPNLAATPADLERYYEQIERGLSDTELQRVPLDRIADADMAIIVYYAVSDPGLVGYSSKVPMFQTSQAPGSEEGTRQGGSNRGSGQNPSGSPGVVDPSPSQELIGTQSYTFVRTNYWRDFSLQAIKFDWDGTDNATIQKTGSLWSVSVSTVGSSPNLDEVLPVMIAAAKPFIGTDSEEVIIEKMNGIDRRIKMISEGR
jgi:hypothetical protein